MVEKDYGLPGVGPEFFPPREEGRGSKVSRPSVKIPVAQLAACAREFKAKRCAEDLVAKKVETEGKKVLVKTPVEQNPGFGAKVKGVLSRFLGNWEGAPIKTSLIRHHTVVQITSGQAFKVPLPILPPSTPVRPRALIGEQELKDFKAKAELLAKLLTSHRNEKGLELAVNSLPPGKSWQKLQDAYFRVQETHEGYFFEKEVDAYKSLSVSIQEYRKKEKIFNDQLNRLVPEINKKCREIPEDLRKSIQTWENSHSLEDGIKLFREIQTFAVSNILGKEGLEGLPQLYMNVRAQLQASPGPVQLPLGEEGVKKSSIKQLSGLKQKSISEIDRQVILDLAGLIKKIVDKEKEMGHTVENFDHKLANLSKQGKELSLTKNNKDECLRVVAEAITSLEDNYDFLDNNNEGENLIKELRSNLSSITDRLSN